MRETCEYGRLQTLAWGEEHFGSLMTNRQFPRRAMRRLVERGLARSVGVVEACDDDGFRLTPSRWREGFVLTDAGRARLAEYDNAD
jgi:hypothetical protein